MLSPPWSDGCYHIHHPLILNAQWSLLYSHPHFKLSDQLSQLRRLCRLIFSCTTSWLLILPGVNNGAGDSAKFSSGVDIRFPASAFTSVSATIFLSLTVFASPRRSADSFDAVGRRLHYSSWRRRRRRRRRRKRRRRCVFR